MTRSTRPVAAQSDADILRAAYTACGRTQAEFARDVLDCSLSAFTDWLRGEPCFAPIVHLCWAISKRPELADEIEARFRR